MSNEEHNEEIAGDVSAGEDSGQEPQERRGRKPRNSVIDPDVLAKTKAEARAADGEKKTPAQAMMMNPDMTRSGIAALLAKQRQMPPVTVEDADRVSHDPNEFPECVRRLIREKRFYFCWMKDPFGRHVSQSDMNQSHRVLRAWGGGIYDIVTRENMGEWVEECEYSDDGVVRRLDQILLFTPWAVYERLKEHEQNMDSSRLEATKTGHDEEGQIPGARPVPSDLGPDAYALPNQHGMNAPIWPD